MPDLSELKPVDIISLCVWGEARGEPPEGQLAVLNCIDNRFHDSDQRFGKTYNDVVLKPYQFSCFNANDPNYPKIQKLADRLDEALSLREQPISQIWFLAIGVLGEDLLDNTNGANHYYAWGIKPPFWARKREPVARVGRHLFFKL